MEEAQAALEAAGERNKEIDRRIAEKQQQLDVIDARRKKRGSGRPPKGEKQTYNRYEREIERLRRSVLPDEAVPPHAPRTPGAGRMAACLGLGAVYVCAALSGRRGSRPRRGSPRRSRPETGVVSAETG